METEIGPLPAQTCIAEGQTHPRRRPLKAQVSLHCQLRLVTSRGSKTARLAGMGNLWAVVIGGAITLVGVIATDWIRWRRDRATRWQQERRLAYVRLLARFEAYVWAAADASVQIAKYGESSEGCDEQQWGIEALESMTTHQARRFQRLTPRSFSQPQLPFGYWQKDSWICTGKPGSWLLTARTPMWARPSGRRCMCAGQRPEALFSKLPVMSWESMHVRTRRPLICGSYIRNPQKIRKPTRYRANKREPQEGHHCLSPRQQPVVSSLYVTGTARRLLPR
jgi:hypothetical protein